jgi:sugar phosphate permease
LVSFLPLYLRTVRGLPVTGTAIYTWIQISGAFFGYVSSEFFHDRFGRRPTFTVAYVGIATTMVLFLFLPAQSTVVGYLLIFLLGFTLHAAAGRLGAFLSELFPPDVRGAGVGFAYNVGRGSAHSGRW